MVVKDKQIEQLVNTHTPVKIGDKEFYIERSPLGCCDDCYFRDKQCATNALTICCSNGGNILKLKDNENTYGK